MKGIIVKSNKRNMALLVLTALIWGTGFVAQSAGGDAIGAFSFNSIRMLVGAAALLPVIKLLDKTGLNKKKPQTARGRKNTLIGGVCCGVILTVASNFQQQGITMGTSAGKAGFITACYIVFVPIIGILVGKKINIKIIAGVGLTVIGLYMLCMNGEAGIQKSDLIVLVCSVCYAVHIMVIDHFSPKADGVRMSCIQFLVCGLLTALPMIIFEIAPLGIGVWRSYFNSFEAWVSILYAGILSCGVAYTLQIVGQVGVEPTLASMLLSLESVFSVISGRILLHQYLGIKEIMGCVLIFAAIVLAQLPDKKKT